MGSLVGGYAYTSSTGTGCSLTLDCDSANYTPFHAGLVAYAATLLYGIANAGNAAERWNEKHGVQLYGTVGPAGGEGITIALRF